VAERRAKARKEMEKLRKKGKDIQPVELINRKIAASFWGKGWCDHLESFSDYSNRLPRGRTYVRNGSVCHLEVKAGRIEAFVSGSELYKVTIEIKPLVRKTWDVIKTKCRGQIGSVLELLQGKLSNHVMEVVSGRKQGLFPQPGEIQLKCSCPDWATMCKHVAAVLYGVGSRLDHRPELLFVLRGVDADELISADVALPTGAAVATAETIEESALAGIFGVDIETGDTTGAKKTRRASASRAAASNHKDAGALPPELPSPKHKKAKKATAKKRNAPVFDPKAPTGDAIVRLRKLTGLSVAEFAQTLGVSVPSVQRWENTPGTLRLYARPLAALAKMQKETVAK
jgi:uncharacterized Zn finger protein